ncbi:hypothetical protein G7Y79_00002g007510 [Physcia stellaris]|nr:hypothetical protein G7Y79_00002g007510 [Physcia stellaris]
MSSPTISYYHIPVFTSPNSALFSTMRSPSPQALGYQSPVPTYRDYGSIIKPNMASSSPSSSKLSHLSTKEFLDDFMTYSGDSSFSSIFPWFYIRIALLKILMPLVLFLLTGICILVVAEKTETRWIGFYLFVGSAIGLIAFVCCFRIYMRWEMEAEWKCADLESANVEYVTGVSPLFESDDEDEEMRTQEVIFAEDGEMVQSDRWVTMFSSSH